MDDLDIAIPLKATLISLFKGSPLIGWKVYGNLESTKVVLDFDSVSTKSLLPVGPPVVAPTTAGQPARHRSSKYRRINNKQQRRNGNRADMRKTSSKAQRSECDIEETVPPVASAE